MNGLLAVLGPSAAAAAHALRRPHEGAPHGAGGAIVAEEEGLLLAVRDRQPARGRTSRASRGHVHAVADAALYYRSELVQAVRAAGGSTPPAVDAPPAMLAIAAYDAWGPALASRLEGDVALLLWDGARRRLVAARDFVGRRPLYVATLSDGGVAVASEVGSLLALASCPRELNRAALAGVAAGLPESPWDTAYAAIRVLPAGRTLTASLGPAGAPLGVALAGITVDRHWTPPTFESRGGAPFREAAEELGRLLGAAVAERLDAGGPTAVWLSGGWDSTAIYGAGMARLPSGQRPMLRAVSMSYPPGDPGREDELIEQVTGFWGARATWCDSRPIALFGAAAAEGAAARELPFAHPYALWTRALAAATRESGAVVALDGSGGDQLFQLSPIYLADLLRRGRLLAARREWRARDMTGLGWRRFFRYAVLPNLPSALSPVATALRGGRPLHGIRSWPLPPWIRRDFAAAHDLGARAESRLPRRRGERHGAHETRWFFESSYSPTVLAAQESDARCEGVEVRSPLLDARVVAHAALRPREERSDRGETKRLLRAAVRGLLPDDFLAPRRSRTGTTTGYYRTRLLAELPGVASSVQGLPALSDVGIVEPEAFAAAVKRSLRGGDQEFDVALFYTIQAELWLRSHG